MTSIDTWSHWVAIIVTGGPILLACVSIVFNLYLSRRHLDAMMEAMKNSRYTYIWGAAWRRQGWFGGFVLINKIAGMVLWPKAYIRYGEVTHMDIENFPPRLKRLLTVYIVILFGSLSWMAIVAMLLKFR
ncbi:hypothetical protein [Pseudomonas sp. VI4.1]|uniref:hypothetical protein n=1 Tax=Pseudomonas sp. VI4.1 TaxID=1941346 RepID=UPI0009C6DC8E|nr:hypothetical protein [Pseudomonas sp. VI4.1]OPK09936.1 hypothetical protein BZ163_13205 [Pseudomonas sp. VI4.1]